MGPQQHESTEGRIASQVREAGGWIWSQSVTALWHGAVWLAVLFPLVLGLVALWSDHPPALAVLSRRVLPYHLLFSLLLGIVLVMVQARYMVIHATWTPLAPRMFRDSAGLAAAGLFSLLLWGILAWQIPAWRP